MFYHLHMFMTNIEAVSYNRKEQNVQTQQELRNNFEGCTEMY